ncbi:hypothetical protein ACFQ9Z_38015 [Streptomyces sp. NPDC056580]|uniref:hypothetical protein n=1 Tax=Streptomyces sp. NPDC056580 TaxID=3345872 RepID=UPI00368CC59E
MTLSRVIDTIAGQLEMAAPADGWTAQDFVDTIAALPVEPLIVLDALDEARESVRITVELLGPLARREYADGPRSRPCRLLVGVRQGHQWAPAWAPPTSWHWACCPATGEASRSLPGAATAA